MTNMQVLLDYVVMMLVAQGHSAKKDGSCVYRAPDCSKCGIGQLLPNANYHPAMEGRTASSLRSEFPGLMPPWLRDMAVSSNFLEALQNAHDSTGEYETADMWRVAFLKEARQVARDYGLNTALIDFALQIAQANADNKTVI